MEEPDMKIKSSEYSTLKTDAQRVAWIADLFERRMMVLRSAFRKRYPSDGMTFENYQLTDDASQAKALAVCKRFADRIMDRISTDKNAGVGLFFFGLTGTGKTHLSQAILRRTRELGCPGLYITASDLFDLIEDVRKNTQAPVSLSKLMDLLTGIAVLVIDEVGVSSWTPAERKRLQQIFDARVDAELPTIIITNLDLDEAKTCIGDRLMSRITGETYPLQCSWSDFRQIKAPSRMSPEELF